MKRLTMRTIKYIAITSIVAIMITGCNSVSTEADKTDISRTVEYNKDSLKSEVANIISSGDTSGYDNIKANFDVNDICIIDDNTKYYFYHNSIYVQTEQCIFRFQLDKDYNIESYIKYRLEG